jgi:type III restriction enzyme
LVCASFSISSPLNLLTPRLLQKHYSGRLSDFVAKLKDGRTLVIEYKGEVYKTNDDSKEKKNLGQLWAEKSGGKTLFLMAVERDEQGRDVYQQIENAISG